MANVYDQHRASFSNVSAYVITYGGERVATIAFKFGTSVIAYVHWCGVPMRRGRAGGSGYDRQSAACADALRRVPRALDDGAYSDGTPHHTSEEKEAFGRFWEALTTDDGCGWDHRLRDAGFKVWQAI